MVLSLFQKVISCATGKERVSELTDSEIAAVKDVWTRASNGEIGAKILGELIDKKPSFAAFYGFDTTLPGEELRKSSLFLLQARRIQSFLDTAVSSLGLSPDTTIHRMSYRIGQIHYYKGVNFGADNWLVFKKVTIEQVIASQKKSSIFSSSTFKDSSSSSEFTIESMQNGLQHQKSSQATVGWNKLMAMVIREMKRGFLDEARRNCGDDSETFS